MATEKVNCSTRKDKRLRFFSRCVLEMDATHGKKNDSSNFVYSGA